jgi:uncharacterized membrane protein YfcA
VITGGLSNVTSGGAGIFTIFFLTAYAGLAIQASTGTVLAASTVIVLVGAVSFARKGQVNTQLALTVGLSGVTAAFLAARWASTFKSAELELPFGIFTLALALYTAYGLLAGRRKKAFPAEPTSSPAGARVASRWMGKDPLALAVQVAKGAFIGVATGLFGVGLASLSIILFLLLFNLDMKTVLGTSLFASFMRYLGGSFGYLSTGLVDPYYFLVIVAGGTIGSVVGAKFILGGGRGYKDEYVKVIVVCIMLFVSYEFLFGRISA